MDGCNPFYTGSNPVEISMKNAFMTHVRNSVAYYPPSDRYVLRMERRSRLYDTVTSLAHKPFRWSGYGANVWGSLWEWAMVKGDERSEVLATFVITKDEAEQIAPGIGDKLDLTWLDSQSSDEH